MTPLTDVERARFLEWLDGQVADLGAVTGQMTKLNMPENVVKQFTIRQAACSIVANELRRTERDSIEAQPDHGATMGDEK